MDKHLKDLEAHSIYILREAYANFSNLAMLWSIGKDSTVMLWLARKAFLGHVPFPLVHIDTGHKIPEMIAFRDKLAKELQIDLIYGQNEEALSQKETFPDNKLSRLECCKVLKTDALKQTLSGSIPRYRFDKENGKYIEEPNPSPYTGVIVGGRADEEGSRSKERYFSARDTNSDWNVEDQPPELWNQFKTDFAPGTHVRIHPLLDWSEINIWEYIAQENIPIIDLYFNKGDGKRYRSLGCLPCSAPIESQSRTPMEIVEELKEGALKNVAERSGRKQDDEDGGGLETLRREGYM